MMYELKWIEFAAIVSKCTICNAPFLQRHRWWRWLGTSSWPQRRGQLNVLKFITHSPTGYESLIINSLNYDQSACFRLVGSYCELLLRSDLRDLNLGLAFGIACMEVSEHRVTVVHSNTWNSNRFMLWYSWISHDLLIAVCCQRHSNRELWSLVDLVADVWSWCTYIAAHSCWYSNQ